MHCFTGTKFEKELCVDWDECSDTNNCIREICDNAGYEIHKKGEVEETEEAVAARLRLGTGEGGEQGDGDQSSIGSDKKREPQLTQAELVKLRKHMKMWPG